MNAPLSSEQQEHAYLARLGERVRAWRGEQGMTRKQLAAASGVSERYLAQLEAGQGNMSVLLLRKVARAMGGGAGKHVGAAIAQGRARDGRRRRAPGARGRRPAEAGRPPRPARRRQIDA